jgi:broad-specificity NMP kinase
VFDSSQNSHARIVRIPVHATALRVKFIPKSPLYLFLATAMRSFPNIIVTGTPGVGKTTTCDQIISLSSSSPTPLKRLDINALVKSKNCHEGFDDNLQTYIVDEEKLLDEVEAEIHDGEGADGGGWVIDWHACDLFPERWIDLVVVLRCQKTDVLFDRLQARNYPESKMQENMDAEIFGVIAEEAREGFEEGVVVELQSEKVEQVEENCERILQWVKSWMKNKGQDEKEDDG